MDARNEPVGEGSDVRRRGSAAAWGQIRGYLIEKKNEYGII
jgi:hypothetical protein